MRHPLRHLDNESDRCADICSDCIATAHHGHADGFTNATALPKSNEAAHGAANRAAHGATHHGPDAVTNQTAQRESYNKGTHESTKYIGSNGHPDDIATDAKTFESAHPLPHNCTPDRIHGTDPESQRVAQFGTFYLGYANH